MSFSLKDFPASDLGQYFNDTWVQYRTPKGKLRAGYIEGFAPDLEVYLRCDSQTHVVSIDDIAWHGLMKTRCMAYDGKLVFVGPSGSRSHKKPPTHRNTVAVVFDPHSSTPIIWNSSLRRSGVPSSLIERYLDDDMVYPPDAKAAIKVLRDRCNAIALTPRHGVLWNEVAERYWCVTDSVIVNEARAITQAHIYIKEVYNGEE